MCAHAARGRTHTRAPTYAPQANEGCVGGFGVDEAVNAAGGPELKDARRQLNGCATGNAKVTPAFAHTGTRWIIHAVGPVFRTSRLKKNKTEAELDEDLCAAYRSALRCADEVGAETVGFCLLSCGVFRGERDLESVIEIGMRAVTGALVASCPGAAAVREVTFVAYTDEEQRAATAVCDRMFCGDSATCRDSQRGSTTSMSCVGMGKYQQL